MSAATVPAASRGRRARRRSHIFRERERRRECLRSWAWLLLLRWFVDHWPRRRRSKTKVRSLREVSLLLSSDYWRVHHQPGRDERGAEYGDGADEKHDIQSG